MSDEVDHPPHYTHGRFEPIDVIEDWKLGFALGNALKYIARAEHKGTALRDLRKAAWYLAREIGRRASAELTPAGERAAAPGAEATSAGGQRAAQRWVCAPPPPTIRVEMVAKAWLEERPVLKKWLAGGDLAEWLMRAWEMGRDDTLATLSEPPVPAAATP